MIFSEIKLKELANLKSSITTKQIVDAINSIGFEVESIKKFNNNKGLKFGHVLETYKNPNSNKLTVCKIKFNDKIRTIQTTAKNVKKNDYIIAFIPGSFLGDVEIKTKKIGGIESEGMLASFEELGFNKDLLRNDWKENILILPNKVDLNLDPIEYFNLNDVLIEVSILSNRSDAQCYNIFAIELAAYFKTKPKKIKHLENNIIDHNFKLISNDINDLHGVVVEINKINLDLQSIMLLLKTNYKSINDLEDIATLNLIYCGVSSRLIDVDKLKHKELEISSLKKIKIKDQEHQNIHVLINKGVPISILGVDTLEEFKPNENSKNVLIEFSKIDSKLTRDNSRNTKIATNSSINNSKEISDGSILMAYEFYLKIFKNISSLINPISTRENKIKYDIEYLNKYAGFDITKNPNYRKAIESLKILGFKFNKKNIEIPLYRHDITRMQDVVEEVFRFFGFENFNPVQPKVMSTLISGSNELEIIVSSLGYKQALTYTLLNKEKNNFNPFKFKDIFNLQTFVSEEFSSIRNSIAIPMANIFEYNIKRKIDSLSLFDIGMINNKKALIIASNEKSYEKIKEDISKILKMNFEVRQLKNNQLHPNYNAGIYVGNKLVGWIGKFNPKYINLNIIFAEILIEFIPEKRTIFKDYNPNPLKERDVTFSIEDGKSIDLFIKQLKKINGIFSIKFLYKYKKENKVNLTYRIKINEDNIKELDKFISK